MSDKIKAAEYLLTFEDFSYIFLAADDEETLSSCFCNSEEVPEMLNTLFKHYPTLLPIFEKAAADYRAKHDAPAEPKAPGEV